MFAKPESTEWLSAPFGETEPWLAKKEPAAGADPEDDELADDVDEEDEVEDDALEDDDLDDEDLDDDDLDDDDLDDDDLEDELDDDLIELDDEFDKGEEEKHRPAHPGKYDD